jgi:hypothetical protein
VKEHANHQSRHVNPVFDLAQTEFGPALPVAGAMAPGAGFGQFDTSGNPGVPAGVIRNLLTARAPACACSQYLELARAE